MLGINAITITPEILSRVSDVDEFKGLWKGLERHTAALNLLGDVADYGTQFGRVLDPLRQHDITPDLIKAVHTGDKTFKTQPNTLAIESSDATIGTLETAAPEDVLPLLTKLCDWVNESLTAKTLHPLIVVAVFTSVFLQLAPFESGNIKTARFLIVLIMLKAGYTYAPYVSLTPMMEQGAQSFYDALAHNQKSLESGRADWGLWLSFFLGVLAAQKSILQSRLEAKKTDVQTLPALSIKIMNLFKTHERLQMNQIIKLTKGRRATIKLRLLELVEGGYLRRHGQGRGTWYALI